MNHSNNAPRALTVVGPGRVGESIAKAATEAGIEVELIGRDFPGTFEGRDVLICVPDTAIPEVAARMADSGRARVAGHTSGVTTLDPLASCQSEGAFSIHPLQTVPDGTTDLRGCPSAIAGSNPSARDFAAGLAETIGMAPFEVAEPDRALYHAAASIASNYLVALEQTAADLLDEIGVEAPREVLAPLVRRTLENWETRGQAALTGPIVRGDEGTVDLHRDALESRRPDLLPLYDTMADRTRALVASGSAPGVPS